MNVRDSESAAGVLCKMGYEQIDDIAKADIVLFNTCCIRELAEQKAISAVGAMRKHKDKDAQKIIGVFGCMTQQEGVAQEIKRRFPYVDFIFGTNNIHLLPQLIQQAQSGQSALVTGQGQPNEDFDLPAMHNAPPLAYVNIVFGCNNFCSYCIVPYVRGREESRPKQLIIDEVKSLVDQGYQEVTLLGQNVNSYGKDIDDSFAGLLRALDQTGIERIRFMTSHPKDLSQAMIDAMAECDSVCKGIHLPVQSGSDTILQAMNRKYDAANYLALVESLRKAMPDIGITTDLIVGFPGETEQDYNDTLELVKTVGFDSAYMFAFSPRKGTKAAEMAKQIEDQTKQQRLKRLIALQADITMDIHKSLVGQTHSVLVEGFSRKDEKHLTGRMERGRMVNFLGEKDLLGQTVLVKITRANKNTLFGERSM